MKGEIKNVIGIEEHILVCLSSSPSNAKIIDTAAKMSKAFDGKFTAIYVQTSKYDSMNITDKERLQNNIRRAEKAGADIATVYGNDISYQIAEFARISKVTKIVIGRSGALRKHFWSKPALTEKLTMAAPNIDIHIIPDFSTENKVAAQNQFNTGSLIPTVKDILIAFVILAASTAVGFLFSELGFLDVNIITVYILGVLLTSIFTKRYLCSLFNSLASVFLFYFVFAEPRLTFETYDTGYPITFLIMFAASIIMSSLATKLKNHAKLSSETAFRTKMLFDTSQLLQKANDESEIINITATQLMKLLERNIIVYSEKDGILGDGYLFSETDKNPQKYFCETELDTANWVFQNKKRAGATTNQYKNAKCLYLAIRTNEKVFGVIGIAIDKNPLNTFESNVLLSILGECALAIENIRNAKAKEEESVRAQNEQLRANLLRTISHDLRTPLTAISGNAGYLLSSYKMLDDDTKTQIFTDIYDDSHWLINLVENLLSITRLEEGRLNMNMTAELVDEVIDEALKHISRQKDEHTITVDIQEELLLARMDARLIAQVIINIIDNAIKYTSVGSSINISAFSRDDKIVISVADNGGGVPDDIKPKIFDMFFTSESKIADSRRSMGLGLALCKSIINLHGGEIKVKDNIGGGTVFEFTLPKQEVNINEQAANTCGRGRPFYP